MDTSTLLTKVMLPQLHSRVVRRSRLLDCLYEAADRKAILVTAPAGYGKTTLLADWARELEHPTCWYALDEDDNNPRVFFDRLLLSLGHRFAGFGERTRRVLSGLSDFSGGAAGVVRTLLNEVIEAIPCWFVLMFDDYHRLGDAPQIDAILSQLLASQNNQFLLVIASRSTPQWSSLPLMIARGQVMCLGQDDLSFRPDEMRQALAQSGTTPLSPAEMAKVVERTGGWITGALLAAHAAEWPVGVPADVDSTDALVYEYLAQEIFSHIEPSLQDFLLRSSTLQVMSPSLCQEALGLVDSADYLALLEQRNLFTTRLEGSWYSYHQLVRDYLQARFCRQQRARWAEMHCRAAAWFAAHDQPEDAVRHYVTAEEHQAAAQVMAAAARQMYYAGRL